MREHTQALKSINMRQEERFQMNNRGLDRVPLMSNNHIFAPLQGLPSRSNQTAFSKNQSIQHAFFHIWEKLLPLQSKHRWASLKRKRKILPHLWFPLPRNNRHNILHVTERRTLSLYSSLQAQHSLLGDLGSAVPLTMALSSGRLHLLQCFAPTCVFLFIHPTLLRCRRSSSVCGFLAPMGPGKFSTSHSSIMASLPSVLEFPSKMTIRYILDFLMFTSLGYWFYTIYLLISGLDLDNVFYLYVYKFSPLFNV